LSTEAWQWNNLIISCWLLTINKLVALESALTSEYLSIAKQFSINWSMIRTLSYSFSQNVTIAKAIFKSLVKAICFCLEMNAASLNVLSYKFIALRYIFAFPFTTWMNISIPIRRWSKLVLKKIKKYIFIEACREKRKLLSQLFKETKNVNYFYLRTQKICL
jgi:hypothetical protein